MCTTARVERLRAILANGLADARGALPMNLGEIPVTALTLGVAPIAAADGGDRPQR